MHFHVPILTQLADKFLVREYVSKKIGDQYLNELYKVYYNVDEIDFDKLPNSFVLKGVHGSSLNIIVKDKSKLDIKAAKLTMRKWMKHCQYKKVGYEWAYKNIEPKIIAEKLEIAIDIFNRILLKKHIPINIATCVSIIVYEKIRLFLLIFCLAIGL